MRRDDYFDLKSEELEKYRDVGKLESKWINDHVKEVDYLYLHVWNRDREKTLRSLSRILDFYMDYNDLDMSGDFSSVRQIVINELLIEQVSKKIDMMSRFMEDGDFDVRSFSEAVKLVSSLQSRTGDMIKSLGTSRGARRKDTRENAKIFSDMDIEKLQGLRERVKTRDGLLEDVESKVKSVEGKGIRKT